MTIYNPKLVGTIIERGLKLIDAQIARKNLILIADQSLSRLFTIT